MTGTDCPVCQAANGRVFHRVESVPVHSVRLLRDRAAARAFPRGRISVAVCSDCGFIWNADFEPDLLDYDADYEETQGYSETFGGFQRRLAAELTTRFHLEGKHVVEIGCGKGEFLSLLCELGAAKGTGIDPAYVPERNTSRARDKVTVIRDTLSPDHAGIDGDFVCCKMTLEHIAQPARFLDTVKTTVVPSGDTAVVFQVPEALRILKEGAFWDVYYEHCCYFTLGSLRHLFQRCGFAVLDLWTDYDDQYLLIEARRDDDAPQPSDNGTQAKLAGAVETFAARSEHLSEAWTAFLQEQMFDGKRIAIWGGGSKAVAFLTTLDVGAEVGCVVDLNPHKHGTFLPGSGHAVSAPEALRDYQPDAVIVMNPVYRDEIADDLAALGLDPDLLMVNEDPHHRSL